MLHLDNTNRSTWETCKRKYYYQVERNLIPFKGSTALRYGIVWHKAMEGFYSHIQEHGWTRDGKAVEQAITFAKEEWDSQNENRVFEDDYRTLENLMRALVAYISHFNHDEGMLRVVSTERVFKILITAPNPDWFPWVDDEGGFYFTGRLDAEVLLDARPWQLEFKTTGQPLSLQKQRLHRNPQNIGYDFASRLTSPEPPEGCLISLHQLTAYKSKTTGLYGEPKIDFDRVPEIYTDGDIEEWKLSLIEAANEILLEKMRGLWPMRWDNCYLYGNCTYSNLCSQNAPLGKEVTEGFIEREPWDVTKTVPESEVIVVDTKR